MKLLPTTFGLLLAAALSAGGDVRADAPVVVELFTSQGCSSCPPADAVIGRLATRDDVVALAFHVDYWNYIGWVDPYSDPAWSARQRSYAAFLGTSMIYTPQAMVQGTADIVGSRQGEIERAIEQAKANEPVTTLEFADAGTRLDIGASAAPPEPVEIILVAYRTFTETTVTRGENAGRKLVGHNVVGELQNLGDWDGSARSLAIDLPGIQGRGYDGMAVLLQGRETGMILAAAKFTPTNKPLLSQDSGNEVGSDASGQEGLDQGSVVDGGSSSSDLSVEGAGATVSGAPNQGNVPTGVGQVLEGSN